MTLQAHRIMVAVPPTGLADVVVRRGSEFAQRLGSELRLVACVYDPYVAGERIWSRRAPNWWNCGGVNCRRWRPPWSMNGG
jgi:hypothetical protein